MLIGYRSLKIATPVEIGRWIRPHPDPEYALMGHVVESVLIERPDDDCKPTTVIDETEDIVTKEKRRSELPFVEPILGASWECAGCGESFGKQQRLRRGLFVSADAAAYITNQKSPTSPHGIKYFCSDEFSCSKRALDRVGEAAEKQIVRAERKKIEEITGQSYRGALSASDVSRSHDLPAKECRLQSCKKSFVPPTRTSAYCSGECKAIAEDSRKASAATRQKIGRGRPAKGSVVVTV